MDPDKRTIQARTDDLVAALGSAGQSTERTSRWACGCTATVRLGNDLLCDWQMCATHAPLAPTLEVGGG